MTLWGYGRWHGNEFGATPGAAALKIQLQLDVASVAPGLIHVAMDTYCWVRVDKQDIIMINGLRLRTDWQELRLFD